MGAFRDYANEPKICPSPRDVGIKDELNLRRYKDVTRVYFPDGGFARCRDEPRARL
jgi:hypothetical protein